MWIKESIEAKVSIGDNLYILTEIKTEVSGILSALDDFSLTIIVKEKNKIMELMILYDDIEILGKITKEISVE